MIAEEEHDAKHIRQFCAFHVDRCAAHVVRQRVRSRTGGADRHMERSHGSDYGGRRKTKQKLLAVLYGVSGGATLPCVSFYRPLFGQIDSDAIAKPQVPNNAWTTASVDGRRTCRAASALAKRSAALGGVCPVSPSNASEEPGDELQEQLHGEPRNGVQRVLASLTSAEVVVDLAGGVQSSFRPYSGLCLVGFLVQDGRCLPTTSGDIV